MVGGGLCMIAAGLASGEVARTDLSAVSLRSAAAWLYLVTFGSIVAYPAYIWLLGHVAAARVATYAYVNPVVAVALGWALAGERVGALTLLAAAAIVVSVALVTAGQRAAPAHDPTMRPSEPVGHAASRAVN
jgi:drug/metabolite transporter (DMT)-like permease